MRRRIADLDSLCSVAWVLWEYSQLGRQGGDAKAVRSARRARRLALSQVDYALGRNPEGLVYVCPSGGRAQLTIQVVGASSRSPQRPQSAMAYARTDVEDIDIGRNKHILYGALVGGPKWRDEFSDKRSDWRQTEAGT